MTETEWLALTDVMQLPWEFAKNLSHRKFLLCAVGACRMVEHLLCQEGRQSLRVAERNAEGLASAEECKAAESVVQARIPHPDLSAYGAVSWTFAHYPPAQVMQMACLNAAAGGVRASACADLLRDVFGNPFQPVAPESSCLTPAVTALAQAIYDQWAFDRMAELADALEKAGCKSTDILDHCRGPGPHVRGCWVVDSILGKS